MPVKLILSVTEDFRTRRSPSLNAAPPAEPAPNQDHGPAAAEPERTPSTPAGSLSAPTLTSLNRPNVRTGSVAGPTPEHAGALASGGSPAPAEAQDLPPQEKEALGKLLAGTAPYSPPGSAAAALATTTAATASPRCSTAASAGLSSFADGQGC
jgi:hypothetical protein